MPPSPILAVTAYGPRVEPGSKDMLLSGCQPERVAGEHVEFASFRGIDQLGDLALHDIAPDGQRFLMIKTDEDSDQDDRQVHVVVNWFQELTERVPIP